MSQKLLNVGKRRYSVKFLKIFFGETEYSWYVQGLFLGPYSELTPGSILWERTLTRVN